MVEQCTHMTCEECGKPTQFTTAYGHPKHGLQYICPKCFDAYELERYTRKINIKEGYAVCTDYPIVFIDEDGLEYSHIGEHSHYLYHSSEEAKSVLEVNTERKSHDLLERLKVRKVTIDVTITPITTTNQE